MTIDVADNLYAVTESGVSIEEYDPASPNTPICRYETPSRQGGIQGMTVNPLRGEVFYFSYKDAKIHQLGACSEGKFKETAKFAVTPKPEVIYALAFNPTLAWDASRPAGVLYGAEESFQETEGINHGQGYIFAAPPIFPPQVEAESIAAITATTATIRAQINPKGSPTRYAFQYETEAAYQANEPADRFAGAIEVPIGGAALGSGQEALSAAAALSGPGARHGLSLPRHSHQPLQPQCRRRDSAKTSASVWPSTPSHWNRRDCPTTVPGSWSPRRKRTAAR